MDGGCTYFDTAEDYAAGESERQLGGAVKNLDAGSRDKVVIGSKLLPNHCGMGDVEKYTQGTLDRLQIECIDLYMVHWPIDKNSMAHFASHAKIAGGGRDYAISDQSITPDAPPTEIAFKTLMKLQAAGKIKHSTNPNLTMTTAPTRTPATPPTPTHPHPLSTQPTTLLDDPQCGERETPTSLICVILVLHCIALPPHMQSACQTLARRSLRRRSPPESSLRSTSAATT